MCKKFKNFVKRQLSNIVYIYRHVSIPGDLCHYFLFSSEQNDDLKITV